MLTYSMLIFPMTFILVCYSIRKIIYVAHSKHLFDEPSELRKIHIEKTPNLGGVAIFFSMVIVSCFILPHTSIGNQSYILASGIIIFFLGLTDDLVGMDPNKKILGQLVAALVIVLPGGYRFTGFHGFFGLGQVHYWVSIILSVLFILFITNAFNLIDGIDQLAGGIGLLTCLVFAYFFHGMHEAGLFYLAVALSGCLAGFLVFNRSPARIFMGDTGSLFLGFIIAVFSINFIELNDPAAGVFKLAAAPFRNSPAILFGLMIIPIYDTLRVFILRIAGGKSPFAADRNHLHHNLIDLGLSHLQATGILLLVSVIALTFVLVFPAAGSELLVLCVTAYAIGLNWILGRVYRQKRDRQHRESQKQRRLRRRTHTVPRLQV